MATKKTETPEIPDVKSMGVWEKILWLRADFLEETLKKSGKNTHAEFLYYELKDIVPPAEPLFEKYRLLMAPTFTEDTAVARVINLDKPDEVALFSIPLKFIAEPSKFRMNETQAAGAVVTYYRRYLYMLVLDLVDKDEIDSGEHEKKPLAPGTPAKHERRTPATAEERKKTKTKLTETANAAATDEQIAELKSRMKALMERDPEQEEFVSEIAIRTKNLTEITADQCVALIRGIDEMLAGYDALS